MSLFGKTGPQSSDPIQGMLHNTYLISALSAMATRPEIINNIFLSKEDGKKDGFYSVCLSRSGIMSELVAFDYLPTSENGSPVCKSEESNASLWPMMLEKAYSQLYGCYANIGVEGLTGNVINDFTGAPYNRYMIQDHSEAELEELIAKASGSQALITVRDKENLVHFSVIENNGGKLKIRHPKVADGKFPQGLAGSKNGEAQIGVTQLKNLFESMTIVQYSSSFTLSKMAIPKEEACTQMVSVFQVTTNTNGEFFISWHRSDNRCLIGTKSSDVELYGASEGIISEKEITSLTIFKLNSENEPVFVKGSSSNQRDNCVKVGLDAGVNYIVYVSKKY